VDGLYVEDGINISNYCTYDGGVQIMISSSKSDKVKIIVCIKGFKKIENDVKIMCDLILKIEEKLLK